MVRKLLKAANLPPEIEAILKSSEHVVVPESREQLLKMAIGGQQSGFFEVAYQVPRRGRVVEATVAACNNGVSVNFTEPYMRRRDPNCMVIGDDLPTDKPRYSEKYGADFRSLRELTFDWLKEQNLIAMPFMAGGHEFGYPALMIGPQNAAFFAGGLADLQGFIPRDELPEDFTPRAVIYVAPPFRHTHFDGKQVVVHNRLEDMHEIYSFNLYPGPSAKKGIYGVLLNIGEAEGWVTLHASTVKVTTPYDNELAIMHEGASGGGKSEMIEEIHRERDGTIKVAENSITGEYFRLELSDTCSLSPVTDDMALCPPTLNQGSRKLVVKDAEEGWFLRIDHITKYGTDPHYERLTIHPPEPLVFMNIEGKPDSTCLIWEHIEDEPGKTCPNPRVIMPRRFIPDVANEPVEVDIRSFGVRTPLCTKEKPTYGILGFFHVLPPSLAWLWRLVAPRGHANPSITDTQGMTSEGVGSYWPFATGRMVDQANLLLNQIVNTPGTRYILAPNQHIGAYKVGFKTQWLMREYLARRGTAKYKTDRLTESRCPLLGYSLQSLKVDGTRISKGLLQVQYQPEVGEEAYDQGATILGDFFKRELEKFMVPDLDPLGRKIIECCLADGKLEDYLEFIPMNY